MVEAESEIQSIFVHLPPTLPRQGPVRVVVALHGMGGNGEDFSREFLQMTDANNWLVVAPTIAYGDWTDPAQVANEEPVLIGWLNAYLDASPVEVGLSLASRVLLLGYSRGAQLALRFAEFHPERVRGVAAVAAGTYTLPLSVDAANHSMTFPFGIADLAAHDSGHAFDAALFATIPIWIGVGGEDASAADLPRAWDPYLGTTRLQRARAFTDALRRLNAPVSITVFPRVDHALTSNMRLMASAHLLADEPPEYRRRSRSLSTRRRAVGRRLRTGFAAALAAASLAQDRRAIWEKEEELASMRHARNRVGIATTGLLMAALIVLTRMPSASKSTGPSSAASSAPASTEATATPLSATMPLGAGVLHTDGGDIVDAQGRIVHITGVNWFGLETGTFAPHGLWARGLNDMLDQIVQAGFNTIRVPFSDQLFDPSSTPNGIDFRKNPDLQGLSGLKIMDLLIVRAGERGIKVILDRHRPDASAQSPLWYTDRVSEQQWIDDWVTLANRYRGDPTVIGADLHNEPHGPATWGDGNPLTDWHAAAERAGNAVLQANPDWLIFVEGIEHQGDDWYWWGGNLALAGQVPIQLSVPNKLVYEAHDYGPGVSGQKWFQTPGFPLDLSSVWYSHWAYLKLSNTAPVLIGEFGGRSVGDDAEGIWQRTLISYLQVNGFDYTYWSWNPNSGDTGGILQDDWMTLDGSKLIQLQASQSSLLDSSEPASARPIIAAYELPPLRAQPATADAASESAPEADASPPFAIGGPYDPDPVHAQTGLGGPDDPDAARRASRQADEQLYLQQTGTPWDRAAYAKGN